ncbi:DUF4160 domain-containing protein [Dechloromonas sp. ZS-1]|uniref:DUF4160 domain-containing protein n=1 Tax=Dechloromonas sp. ZS-1 TaxID=3138067 RepID=UPI0031FD629F
MDIAVSQYHPSSTDSSYHSDTDHYQQLFELWNKASKSRRNTTVEEYQRVLFQFADFVGYKALTEITRRDIADFRDSVLASGKSSTTATHKVGMLKSLFVTAINYELLEQNPAETIRSQSKPQIKQRVAFSAEDLQRIFTSRIYSKGFRPKGAGREAAYWLPLLALYTGARVEELAQLLVSDIYYAEGLGHYINISDAGEDQKLKNAGSRRRVPVHPLLISCGFTDYVAALGPAPRLFPHLKPNPRGKLAGYFSNFFSGYLRNDVGIKDTRKVFHSFRHTFKDVCRKVGIEEAVHDALTGHSSASSIGRRYGNEQYPLEPLFEAIERFEITDLDLSHLYVRPLTRQLRAGDLKMISVFFGILVAFSASKQQRDKAPFIIAMWQGNDVAIDIASNDVIWGQLPANKLLLVNAWVEIHRDELLASWYAGCLTGEFFKLDPLR